MTNPETDPQVILDLLEKKGRAGAPELGTTMAIMVQLEKATKVRRDGKIQTGKPGKPPVAWVIYDGQEPPEKIAVEDIDTKPKKERSLESLQASVDDWLEKIKAGPLVKDCECIALQDFVDARKLKREQGCKKKYICEALDKLRREVFRKQ